MKLNHFKTLQMMDCINVSNTNYKLRLVQNNSENCFEIIIYLFEDDQVNFNDPLMERAMYFDTNGSMLQTFELFNNQAGVNYLFDRYFKNEFKFYE